MNKKEKQIQELIQKDIDKINKELEIEKKKYIEEIKFLDKNYIYKPKEKKKKSFFDKLLLIINGKKR